MPEIRCPGCGERMVVNIGESHIQPSRPEKLMGSVICRGCKTGIGIEIQDNIITYVSGKNSYGNVSTNLSEITKALYSEAEICFNSGSPNASAAMCRASIEAALTEKNILGKDLYEKINNAKSILGDIEVGLAHASA